jgi:hypothetical protein
VGDGGSMNDRMFRAWDIKEKKWVEICIRGTTGEVYIIEKDEEPIEADDTLEVDEFIRLYDMNHRPIFENDIVRAYRYDNSKGEYTQLVVRRDFRGTGAFNVCSYIDTLLGTMATNVEIIGNTHTDSHLLKEEHIQN